MALWQGACQLQACVNSRGTIPRMVRAADQGTRAGPLGRVSGLGVSRGRVSRGLAGCGTRGDSGPELGPCRGTEDLDLRDSGGNRG